MLCNACVTHTNSAVIYLSNHYPHHMPLGHNIYGVSPVSNTLNRSRLYKAEVSDFVHHFLFVSHIYKNHLSGVILKKYQIKKKLHSFKCNCPKMSKNT